MTSKINVIVSRKDIEIATARVLPIKTHTSIACDAAVHFVIDEGAKILISEGAFFKPSPSISMPSHDCHVLKVAFATLIADWPIMRVIHHEPFDDGCSKCFGFRIDD